MRYPFVTQTDLKDCGISCLLMIVRYYGGGVSKEYLRTITNTTKEGVSAYNLIEGSKELGFSSYGVKGNIKNINPNNLPCIAHVTINKSFNHFIVIYKVNHKKQELTIADPAKKNISKMSFEDFSKISTNNFIFLVPEKKIQYVESNKDFKNHLIHFVCSNYFSFIYIIIFSIIITLLSIISSFEFQVIIEYVINYKLLNNLWLIIMIFTGIIILKNISNYFRNKEINIINHKLDKFLFTKVYHRILNLPYLYYKNRTVGEITSRMNDLVSIREITSKVIVSICLDFILTIFVLITLLILNIKLTFILILIILLTIILSLLFHKPLELKINKSKKDIAKFNSFLIESLECIETIKNNNIELFIEDNFLLKYSKYNKSSYSYNKLFLIQQFIKDIIHEYGIFLIMVLGSYMVIEENLSISTLITYISLSSYLLEPIKNMVDFIITWKDAKTSYERIKELYEVELVKENSNKINDTNFNTIDINHLSYSYNNKETILKDINMKIQKGEKVLIYGSSGSGKSTLAKILANQLSIDNNKLYLDNKDISFYNSKIIKDNIVYISQQEMLFTDSIYNNIVLDKKIDYGSFLDITELCMISEFANKNILTYDFLLEENGFNISGGQRQRIILARSMLKDAKIYILDESLNEVDIEKERQILKNIFNKYPDKTFIVISHRFHNQDLFDKKYLIKNGVSIEESI